MLVNGIYCIKCGDFVYSRSVHDFRNCSCDSVSVDGGFDYFKIGYKDSSNAYMGSIDIIESKESLYKDWNSRTNKLGLIHFDSFDSANEALIALTSIKQAQENEEEKGKVVNKMFEPEPALKPAEEVVLGPNVDIFMESVLDLIPLVEKLMEETPVTESNKSLLRKIKTQIFFIRNDETNLKINGLG